jgi:outer membrane protein OmpA-like peptidoglycan-associated protein
MLKDDPDLHLTIAGFTDDVGSASENLRISRLRADSVKNALVARGIASDRITAQGFGEKDPIADNATVEGRATNRRVSVRLTLQ